MKLYHQAVIFELLGGICGWVWLLSIPASIILFFAALFFDTPWSYFFYSFICGGVCKWLLRGLRDNGQRVMLEIWLIDKKGVSKETARRVWTAAYKGYLGSLLGNVSSDIAVSNIYKLDDDQIEKLKEIMESPSSKSLP